ncbi:MAG: hypothetical protein GY865_18645 [candidate division Zixibacteria bacterium]|nr:hypothetical protein [candidate division Zixibacteria bacterium]
MKMRESIILIGIIVMGMASFSAADVIIETKTDMDMIGAGKVDMSQVQYIKNDRSYDESVTTLSGQMAAMTGGKKVKNVQIVRLDKGIGWTINPDEKSFTEFSFEQMKSNFAQSKQQNQANTPLGEYDWKTDISKDLKTETILDVDCKGIRAVSVGVNKNDPKDSVFITNEQWFSDEVSGGDEFIDYSEKMAEAVGTGKGFMNQMSMNPMLARFGNQFEEIAKEFEACEGIPLKTVLIVEGTINPMAAAMGDRKLDEETKAMMKKMGMALPDETPEGGRHNFISLTSTITKIEEKSIEDSRYEVPEGYQKK